MVHCVKCFLKIQKQSSDIASTVNRLSPIGCGFQGSCSVSIIARTHAHTHHTTPHHTTPHHTHPHTHTHTHRLSQMGTYPIRPWPRTMAKTTYFCIKFDFMTKHCCINKRNEKIFIHVVTLLSNLLLFFSILLCRLPLSPPHHLEFTIPSKTLDN